MGIIWVGVFAVVRHVVSSDATSSVSIRDSSVSSMIIYNVCRVDNRTFHSRSQAVHKSDYGIKK